MRRYSGGLVSRRSRGAVAPAAALVAAALAAAAAAPASATITPTRDPATATNAAVAAGFPLSTQGQFFLAIPPNGNPVATADAASGLAGFPREGSTFLILSTGDATRADQPDQAGAFPSVDDGQDQPIRQGGASAFDISELQINFVSIGNVSSGCLGVDFRFLSEEYPSKLGAQFNDAFIAEGDNATGWTSDATSVSAPENFASQPFGQPLTIDSGAPIVMSPAEAAGTPYGAATGVMHAQIQVPAAGSHRLQLTLLDHGDAIVDSAVFIDNVTFASGATCTRGVTSLGPAVAITGPTVAATVNTPTPTLTGTANGPGAVTARIYSGARAAGAPAQTLPAARVGNAWSAVSGALAPGQYTVQATQASATPGVNGVSAPRTFTVVPGPGGAGAGGAGAGGTGGTAGGGSSSQQTPGDRDNDGIPDDQDTSDGSLPPVPGKTFDARVVSGDVFIKYPPGTGPRAAGKPPKGFVALKGAANIPMGAQLDTRKGRVAVTSAHDTSGTTAQTADFYDGLFAVKQSTPKTKPATPKVLITDLVLEGEPPRSECAPIKGAAAAAAKKKKRAGKSVLGSLWGNGKGRFRTNGKYSSATVRGTIWLTQDRCDGTLTTVKRGTVSVRDFKRRKTVSVKAGHSYLARAASKSQGAK
jgi:hypothetical protein